MNTALHIQEIPVTGSLMRIPFHSYKSPKAKLERSVDDNSIIRLRRNLYLKLDGNVANNFLVANYILSPSYVTGVTALSYYGLIPEYVCDTISFTTKKTVSYNNVIGHFTYRFCNPDYFFIGINHPIVLRHQVALASPEKALCDHILMTPNLNLRYVKETIEWLEQDMRMDLDMLSDMDLSIIQQCARYSQKTHTLNNIIRILHD